jgi:crotonobetainyl-CoA:carnitine CoA-transferase CaiB-like acyl-CoA transferase
MADTKMFEGVRVVELAQWVFVPAAGMALAELGADVVKIENPATGDPYRGLMTQGIGASVGNVNLNWEQNNRGKRSIALDIRTERGRELMYKLIATADVFLTNFRPEALERLGYGVAEMRAHNPRLIYARGHGYGVRGPEADTAAYDSTAFWSRGGMAHTLTPFDYDGEVASRGAIGDKPSGINLAFGIAAALFRRSTTGEGSIVDTSLLGSAVWTISSDIMSAANKEVPADPAIKPNRRLGGYRTKDDRLLVVSFLNAGHWPGIMKAIGRDDLVADPRYNTRDARIANEAAYEAEVEGTFASKTFDEWCELLRPSLGPWAPVQSADEVVRDPQVVANNYLPEITSPEGTKYRLAAIPVEFNETPIIPDRAPDTGEHSEEILQELGYSWDDIIQFKIDNVVA